MLKAEIEFEDINAEVARRALGKNKWKIKEEIKTPEESIFGCAGGLHAKKGNYYYCPAFVIPSGYDIKLCFDIHNFVDVSGEVGVKVTDVISGITIVGPAYGEIGEFEHIRCYISMKNVTESQLWDISLGIKLDNEFTEQSRFRVAIQVSGKSPVPEYSANQLDIVYPTADEITVYPTDKPYPIATALWLYILNVEGKYDIRLLPVIHLQGNPIKGSTLIFWAMNAGYRKAAIDLRASAFDINEAYYELQSLYEDLELGYSETIIRTGIEVTIPESLQEKYAITFAFALGHQGVWWKPWDWKADEALMVAWGREPGYDSDVIRAGVAKVGKVTEKDLREYASKFSEECIHRGAVGSYPVHITFYPKFWGGVLDTEVISPSYSPIPPLIALVIIFAAIAAIIWGVVVLYHEYIRHEELKMFQSQFDESRFKTERERILYDQSHYPDEMKSAGKWGKETPEGRRFEDVITGEPAPPEINTPVKYFDWMKARHPDWARDVYGEEKEVKIGRVIAYSAAAVGLYIVGGFLPEKFKSLRTLAVIPGMLAAYESYKFFRKIPLVK